MPKTTTTKFRVFVVIICASAEERVDDFPLPLVVRREVSGAAGDYRTSLGNWEAAAPEQPAREQLIEVAVPCRVRWQERGPESSEPFRRRGRSPPERPLLPGLPLTPEWPQ